MSATVEKRCICGDGIICAAHARPLIAGFRQTIAAQREQIELLMEALAASVKCLQEAAEKTADAVAVGVNRGRATHRCIYCGARWRLNQDGTSTLISPKAGPCCNNEKTGHQIIPLPPAGGKP